MSITEVLFQISQYLWYLFQKWLNMLIISITNPTIVWITIPIYLTWFVTEYFQEKQETSFGNAATNGVITSYVSLDWVRQIVSGNITFSVIKLLLAIILMLYGLYVTYIAIKKKPVAKILGRVKYVAYFQIMLTVLVYSEYTGIELNLDSVMAILFGLPFIWVATRVVDKYLPDIMEDRTSSHSSSLSIEEKINFDTQSTYGSNSYNWSAGYRQNYNSQNTVQRDWGNMYKPY